MPTNHQTSKQTEPVTPPVIELELLALDLNSCTRCLGTLHSIETAIDTVRPILEVTGTKVNLTNLVIESEEQAHQHRFLISPTVRINGKDIAFDTLESKCESCTDLCGCNEGTSCRVWRYREKEYPEAPVGLVVESILREIFGASNQTLNDIPSYRGVPDNLRRFFSSKLAARPAAQSCCPPAEQETCCDSSQKASCCDASEPQACGCRPDADA